MDSVLKSFGKIIKTEREKMNLSQEQLAELCGLHRTYISQIERGLKSASIKVLFSLAYNLNTTPSNLIRKTEKEL